MGRFPPYGVMVTVHAVRITLHYQHGQKFAHPTRFGTQTSAGIKYGVTGITSFTNYEHLL
jgi:hypothetical protein